MSEMPVGMSEVFKGFFQEYSIIQAKWRMYGQLFGTPESIELLNRHGALTFGVIEDLLIKDVILCITRMLNTSKASWGDPANLATLLIDLAAHKQVALVKRLTAIRDRARPVADALKRLRDEQLSRNRYADFVEMKADIDAMPPQSRKMVDDVIASMGEIVKELQARYTGVDELNEQVAETPNFDELVSHLRSLETLKARAPG
jgi:hypothetical protein